MFRTVFMLCGLVLMGTTARGESPALPSSALLAPYEKIPKNKTELIETLLGEMREGGSFCSRTTLVQIGSRQLTFLLKHFHEALILLSLRRILRHLIAILGV